MSYPVPPYCWGCKHYGKADDLPETCPAFPYPARIPGKVYFGRTPHNKVLPGQVGDYVYTPIPPPSGEGDRPDLPENSRYRAS